MRAMASSQSPWEGRRPAALRKEGAQQRHMIEEGEADSTRSSASVNYSCVTDIVAEMVIEAFLRDPAHGHRATGAAPGG